MTQPYRFRKMFALAGATAMLAGGSLLAGDGKVVIDDKNPVPAPEPWTICDIFDYSTLYESDTGFINEVSLVGRYHGQWHHVNGDESDSDWENRRWRAGVAIVFLNDFEFEGQFNINPDEGRFVEDVENIEIAWEPNDELYVIVGKTKPKITREYSTSSKRIKTVERSQMVNQTVPDKIGGLIVGYQFSDPLFAEVGAYADTNTDDWSLPFDGDSNLAVSARIGYDLNENTELRFDYFYADGAGEGGGVEEYDNIFSWNSQSDWDRFHLVTDLIYATGVEAPRYTDSFSVVIMPYYDITDKLEGVFRYTYSTADGDQGVDLQSRYEDDVASLGTRGDNYHAFYAGLNYYICKDKLKLMTGVEYATMDRPHTSSYDSWTYFAAVRLYY